MPHLGHDADLDIPCENCGVKTKKNVRELKVHPTFVCPGCKTEITVDLKSYLSQMAELEKTLKKLGELKL